MPNAITKNKKYGRVFQDDDGHWYLVPEEIKGFSEALDTIVHLDIETDEWCEATDYFEERFGKYRLSGGIESLKVLIEEK